MCAGPFAQMGELPPSLGRGPARTDAGVRLGWQEQVSTAWGVEVRGLRARGGNAEVYEGYQPDLDRRVALKVTSGASEEQQERFRREARTIARLSHPHVVPLHNFGVFDDAMVIMMPWFEASLADRLKRGALPVSEARELLEQMRDALGYVHANGILHRDVKPSNIMLGPEGRFVLADLGIASIDADSTLTRAGSQPGTPGYMAPEVITGDQPGPSSDLYALGATLYEAVVGRPPFDADNAISAAYMHVHGPVPEVALEDRSLAAAIRSLLSKDAGERLIAATPPASSGPARQRGVWIVGVLGVLALLALGIVLLGGDEPGFDASTLQACPRGNGQVAWPSLEMPGQPALAAALIDGDLAPAVSSPSELVPGPGGNASVLLELPRPHDILYVAAALDTEEGAFAGPVYVRLCSALPCGQTSGDQARVLDPKDGPWFSSSIEGEPARYLRLVWGAGESDNDSRLLELCAATSR